LAWFAFRENVDRRIALGMLAIVIGAMLLSWPTDAGQASLWPSLAVLGACLAWGLDNNLTRKVSLNDASWIAAVKGLASGLTNLVLAMLVGAAMPDGLVIAGAMVLGFLAYGVSLALFVVALRHLGTSRTGAYFSIAPFFGAVLALSGGESLSWPLIGAGILMAVGIYLHLTERHEHVHKHEALAHDHEHTHDVHHLHEHSYPVAPGTRHRHWHQHSCIEHAHAHFPDVHHRHRH
jgi:drug/metabolite transporter (DMT)-like permease